VTALARRLSPHFTLGELTKTQIRADNTPPPEVIERLILLCHAVLERVRDEFGPVIVNSGYRSPEVNRAVGGSRTSDHMTGEAADFEVRGVSNYELACWVREHLKYNQLILEMYVPGGDPNAGWVHCSYKENGNKNEVLTFDGRNYLPGLIA
jgi:hypothetical protein